MDIINIEISILDKDNLFDKATSFYYNCVNNDDNKFLAQEYEIDHILIIKNKINITISNNNFVEYTIEVILKLEIESKEIGKYIYLEDKNGHPIDDYLIFY